MGRVNLLPHGLGLGLQVVFDFVQVGSGLGLTSWSSKEIAWVGSNLRLSFVPTHPWNLRCHEIDGHSSATAAVTVR